MPFFLKMAEEEIQAQKQAEDKANREPKSIPVIGAVSEMDENSSNSSSSKVMFSGKPLSYVKSKTISLSIYRELYFKSFYL